MLSILWNARKNQVMEGIVFQKFVQNPILLKKLLLTEKHSLVEANWWNDTWFGVDCKTNEGNNYLGKILLHLFALLQAQGV